MRSIPKEVELELEPSSLLWVDDLSRPARDLREKCRRFSDAADLSLLETWTREAESLLAQGDSNGCAVVLICLADLYRNDDKLVFARKCSEEAEQILHTSRETSHLYNHAAALYSLGVIHYSLGAHDKARDYYNKALEEFKVLEKCYIDEGDSEKRQKCRFAVRLVQRLADQAACGRSRAQLPGGRRVPVLSQVAAGDPTHIQQDATDWVEVDAEIADSIDFALRVRGNSMVGAGILDGDIVLIEQRQDLPPDGKLVVVIIEQAGCAAILGRFYQEGDHIRLEAANNSYPFVIIKPDALPKESLRTRYALSHPRRHLEIYSEIGYRIAGWFRGSIPEGPEPPTPPPSDLLPIGHRRERRVPRYAKVSFPDYTLVERAEVLRVAITIEPVTKQAVELTLEPSSDETEPMQIDACIVVSPLDFDVESPNVQTITVPLDADSAPVIFKLVPKSVGRKTIAVEFFQNTRYLGRAELQATVSQEAKTSCLMSAQTALGLSSSQLPPDLTILFDRVHTSESSHCYRYRLLSYKRELGFWFDEFHTPETTVTPQGFLDEAFVHLNQMHVETAGNEMVFFERLNSIGSNLYGRLFPDDLKTLYWNKIRDNVKSIVIISYEPWIPWELVRPFHPVTKQAEDGFLCEKFDLTRWLTGTAPPDVISLERLGLIVATSGMAAIEPEAAELRGLFGNKAEDIPPSCEAVYQLLKTGGFFGLHFACHGKHNAKDPDWSRLYLAGDATLRPIDVNGDKLVFSKDRPLVFLNACETGQGGYALTGMGGWAEAFIRRANGSGFVGSIWEANDESAHKFAVAFYRHLLEGRTVAEAARLARLEIKRAGDPTWLSYTVYANPLARLAVASGVAPQ